MFATKRLLGQSFITRWARALRCTRGYGSITSLCSCLGVVWLIFFVMMSDPKSLLLSQETTDQLLSAVGIMSANGDMLVPTSTRSSNVICLKCSHRCSRGWSSDLLRIANIHMITPLVLKILGTTIGVVKVVQCLFRPSSFPHRCLPCASS